MDGLTLALCFDLLYSKLAINFDQKGIYLSESEVAMADAGLEAAAQQHWADYLMQVGEGRTAPLGLRQRDERMSVPSAMQTVPNTVEGLIDHVYGDLEHRAQDTDFLTGRAILAPKNVDVEGINNAVIAMMPGEVKLFEIGIYVAL